MDIALIIVPDTPALSWEDRADAQEKWHLAWLEDAALWVHERKALALELEALADGLVAQNQISALQCADAIKGRLPHGGVTREGVDGLRQVTPCTQRIDRLIDLLEQIRNVGDGASRT